jgi:hypothetical protein
MHFQERPMNPQKMAPRSEQPRFLMAVVLALFAGGCSSDSQSPPQRQDAPSPLDGRIVVPEQGPDKKPSTSPCDPPAQKGSLYALSVNDGINDVSMCKYRNRVLLAVNIAAK